MTEAEVRRIIKEGESITVEFKKSADEITKDVYDTVCSFSNREGGHIFLGVKDNGEIQGGPSDAIDIMEKFLIVIMKRIWISQTIQMRFIAYMPGNRTVIM